MATQRGSGESPACVLRRGAEPAGAAACRRVADGLLVLLIGCAALTGCMTSRPAATPSSTPWDRRLIQLQHAGAWQADGRAAAAVDSQGWQASMDWQQQGSDTELRLAGPLGIGALLLNKTAAGISVNGAPPNPAELAHLQERLGFELPLEQLRFWMLGVPDPDTACELVRNDQDRLLELVQDGWSVNYDRYIAANGDLLPGRLAMSRGAVRVRIVVDHWEGPR